MLPEMLDQIAPDQAIASVTGDGLTTRSASPSRRAQDRPVREKAQFIRQTIFATESV
jgi:hypothetical protein